MKEKMRNLLVLCALVSACSPSDEVSQLNAGGTRIGYYKGVDAVSSQMRALMIDPADADQFSFRRLVDGNVAGADKLSNLLGSFTSGTGEESMQNDSPNGLNVMLWKLNLLKFGELLAGVCEHPSSTSITVNRKEVKLHPRFAPILLEICEADEASLVSSAEDLWTGTMGWDAPESEVEAWRAFVDSEAETLLAMPASERVETLLMAIFFNPYYLLES